MEEQVKFSNPTDFRYDQSIMYLCDCSIRLATCNYTWITQIWFFLAGDIIYKKSFIGVVNIKGNHKIIVRVHTLLSGLHRKASLSLIKMSQPFRVHFRPGNTFSKVIRLAKASCAVGITWWLVIRAMLYSSPLVCTQAINPVPVVRL